MVLFKTALWLNLEIKSGIWNLEADPLYIFNNLSQFLHYTIILYNNNEKLWVVSTS